MRRGRPRAAPGRPSSGHPDKWWCTCVSRVHNNPHYLHTCKVQIEVGLVIPGISAMNGVATHIIKPDGSSEGLEGQYDWRKTSVRGSNPSRITPSKPQLRMAQSFLRQDNDSEYAWHRLLALRISCKTGKSRLRQELVTWGGARPSSSKGETGVNAVKARPSFGKAEKGTAGRCPAISVAPGAAISTPTSETNSNLNPNPTRTLPFFP